jgi:hypothetical protein
MAKWVIGICGIAASLVVGLLLLIRFSVVRDLQESKPWITYSRLMYLAAGCDKYRAQYGAQPHSLTQLQTGRPELVDPWDKDAWGREIILVPYSESLGYGQIMSYGRDGKPGGTGVDGDMAVRFPTQANAEWNKQQGVGLHQPRFRP